MAKKISELTSVSVWATGDLFPLVDLDVLETKKITAGDFLRHIPADLNMAQGWDGGAPSWGFFQYPDTDSVASGQEAGGIYILVNHSPAADMSADVIGLQSKVRVSNPTAPLSNTTIYGVAGLTYNYGVGSEVKKMFGGFYEARQHGDDVDEVYGAMYQAANQTYAANNGETTKITGVYSDAYTSDPEGSVTMVVGELRACDFRAFAKTNNASSVSTVTTVYGIYASTYCQQAASSTASVTDMYGIYLTDLREGGGMLYGSVDNYYGVYVAEPTKATTNYAMYIEGRSHFDQPTADAAIPVLTLDQADLSEGFINFQGSRYQSAVGPISGWKTGNSIQGFVRVEINGSGYWMPYYDAPTS